MSEGAKPLIEVRIGPGGVDDAVRTAGIAAGLGVDRIGIGACKQGADWVYFGADLLSEATPQKFEALCHYIGTVHAFRSARPR